MNTKDKKIFLHHIQELHKLPHQHQGNNFFLFNYIAQVIIINTLHDNAINVTRTSYFFTMSLKEHQL